jgi:hypothetical protein
VRKENTSRLRRHRNPSFFRDTFHGPTVIAHPLAREKRAGLAAWAAQRIGGRREEREEECSIRMTTTELETYRPTGASFKCRINA